MTDTEIIERLAEFMGWKAEECEQHMLKQGLYEHLGSKLCWSTGKMIKTSGTRPDWKEQVDYNWNPLKDWNHWRQVEEKLMEDWRLMRKFFESYQDGYAQFRNDSIEKYLQADLPTHCKALVSVLPPK